MRLLSPILQRVVYPAMGATGYFHARRHSSISVITYHGVLPDGYRVIDPFLDNTLISTGAFRKQLRLLKEHYIIVSPEQFRSCLGNLNELPERAVMLTCDDGLLNNLTVMLPILQEERVPCLFFVTGSSTENASPMLWYVELYLIVVGAKASRAPAQWKGMRVPVLPSDGVARRTSWLQLTRALSNLPAQERNEFLQEAAVWWGFQPAWKLKYQDDVMLRERFQLLGPADLKELANAGMTIGAHTMSHPLLCAQEPELASDEILQCRERLERVLGSSVWAMAYPFGDAASVGPREYRLAESAGFECAFLNVAGALSASRNFSLPRVHLSAEMSLPVYEAHISGFHHALQARFRGATSGG